MQWFTAQSAYWTVEVDPRLKTAFSDCHRLFQFGKLICRKDDTKNVEQLHKAKDVFDAIQGSVNE